MEPLHGYLLAVSLGRHLGGLEIIWKSYGNHMEIIWKSYGNHVKNGLMTGHLRPFQAIESIGNEFAASISSGLRPSRPPRASKMSKISKKNWWVQFLRWQFLSVQDSTKKFFYNDFFSRLSFSLEYQFHLSF